MVWRGSVGRQKIEQCERRSMRNKGGYKKGGNWISEHNSSTDFRGDMDVLENLTRIIEENSCDYLRVFLDGKCIQKYFWTKKWGARMIFWMESSNQILMSVCQKTHVIAISQTLKKKLTRYVAAEKNRGLRLSGWERRHTPLRQFGELLVSDGVATGVKLLQFGGIPLP